MKRQHTIVETPFESKAGNMVRVSHYGDKHRMISGSQFRNGSCVLHGVKPLA